jgi:hypothetical protein
MIAISSARVSTCDDAGAADGRGPTRGAAVFFGDAVGPAEGSESSDTVPISGAGAVSGRVGGEAAGAIGAAMDVGAAIGAGREHSVTALTPTTADKPTAARPVAMTHGLRAISRPNDHADEVLSTGPGASIPSVGSERIRAETPARTLRITLGLGPQPLRATSSSARSFGDILFTAWLLWIPARPIREGVGIALAPIEGANRRC